MSGETGYRFLCPGCSASFGWKPQYAGRRIRCKCGQVFVPPDPDAALAASQGEPDPYDVSGDAPPPRTFSPPPRTQAPVAATRGAAGPAPVHATTVAPGGAPQPQANHAAPATTIPSVAALYPGRRARPVAEAAGDDVEGSPLKDLYIPLALLALGLGLQVAQLLVANENRANKWGGDISTPNSPTRAVLLAVFQMIIAGGVMIAGAVLSATLLNLNLGSVGRAGLKLASIAVFATGVASWVAVFDQDRHSVTGLMVALHLQVIIYWIGLAYLFALELQETLLAVAIISLLQAAAMCATWKV